VRPVPALRIEARNRKPVNGDGEFVLYWMTMYRRAGWNFSLQRAVEWAERLRKPLVVLEALSCSYPWASDRLHRFILEGMADNARAFAGRNVFYYPYVEPRRDAGKGLLHTLAARSCMVVADDYPCAFHGARQKRSFANLLLDHLVDARKKVTRDGEPDLLGRLQIEHQLELRRLFHWKIAGFRALTDLPSR
jgi:hypothetical protein